MYFFRYRSAQSLPQCLRSVFSFHNETLNIWTHLLGFVFFLSILLWDFWAPPIPSRITWQVSNGILKKVYPLENLLMGRKDTFLLRCSTILFGNLSFTLRVFLVHFKFMLITIPVFGQPFQPNCQFNFIFKTLSVTIQSIVREDFKKTVNLVKFVKLGLIASVICGPKVKSQML